MSTKQNHYEEEFKRILVELLDCSPLMFPRRLSLFPTLTAISDLCTPYLPLKIFTV